MKFFTPNNTLTLINTVGFLWHFTVLLGSTATPMTAFLAVFTGFAATLGWGCIAYDYEMRKLELARVQKSLNVKKIQ